MANQTNSGNERIDLAYRRRKNAEEMRHQVIAFVLMILLTLIAFAAVGYEEFSHWFVIPFILLLAGVQVAFQLYYFMHMSHKGHEFPTMFMYGGVLVMLVLVWAFSTVIWW